ncbi:MAG: hypothetical protein NVS1B14_09610 [Vulcanimicrobiaceae bacterium]
MKYVCQQCGQQLSVDRDIDDDRTFDYVVGLHQQRDCPGTFAAEESVGPVNLNIRTPSATQ